MTLGRVVQITDKGPGSGGIRRVIEDHADMLCDLGWTVGRLLLTDTRTAHLDPTETTAPITFARGAKAHDAAISALEQIAQGADIIHLHLGLTSVTPLLVQRAAAIAPLIVSLHDISPFEALAGYVQPTTLVTRLARWRHAAARRAAWDAVCKNAVTIHCPSSYLANIARRAGASAPQVAILPHLIPTPTPVFRPSGECEPLIVYAGLLSQPKGAHLLLPVLRLLPDHTRMTICGSGPLATSIGREVIQSNLSDRVILTGPVDRAEVLEWMGKARAVIHPSLIPEGFGLTVLEAMTLGRPVAGFGRGATGDWLTNGETGLIAQPATADALGTALSRLLADPERATRLGKTGASLALAHCAPEIVSAGLDALYGATIARSSAGD